MKNSANRLPQPVKWISPLAAILVAVSLCPSARAQNANPMNSILGPTAVLRDVGLSNQPPTPGPNDYYQTNTVNELQLVNKTGWNYGLNQCGSGNGTVNGGPGGETFLAAAIVPDSHGNGGIAITNLFVQIAAGATTGAIAGGASNSSRPMTISLWPTNTQPFLLNFYQISGTTDPSGLGSNATLISSIVTAPGRINALGDWLSFSNFVVFLKPGTTNAFTWSITTNGYGYAPFPLVTNGGETTSSPGPFANGLPIVISNGSLAVNYGISAGVVSNLYVSNFDTVFSIGVATNFIPPIITTNPPSYNVIAGIAGRNATFFAAGAGSSNALYGINGYWQMSNSTLGKWLIITNLGVNGTDATNVTTTIIPSPVGAAGASVASTLVVSNFSSVDAGTYVFVVTNSPNGTTICSATSAVAVISFVAPPPNSFASAVISNGYGVIGFWPLNETNDPSTGTAEAYEWIGGYNGIYEWNANNGGGNALYGTGPVPFSKVAGPNLPGLSYSSAYGSVQNTLPWTFINVPVTPTFPGGAGIANSTNATMVAWIYPNIATEASQTGLAVERVSAQNDGLFYGNTGGGVSTPNCLGYTWDNGPTSAPYTWEYNSGLNIPAYTWSMVALVITPSNAVFYVCNTNAGIITTYTNQANIYQSWGYDMAIGTDIYGVTSRAFGGNMSSLAIFTNSLSATQIEALYLAGQSQGAPLILTQPAPETVYSGAAAVFTVNATGSSTLYYQWEAGAVGSGVYTNLSNGGNISGANSATLNISSPGQGNIADYIVVVTDSSGRQVASYPATLSIVCWEEAGQAGTVTSVATSPDGNWIASGSDDSTVKIWRTSDYGLECTLGATGLHEVTAVAFGPVGSNVIAAGYYDGTIRLWNTTNFTLVSTFSKCSGKITSLAFSPNGPQLAIGSGDWLTRILNVATGAIINNNGNGTVYNYGVVRSVAYSPDGTLLAVAGEDTNLVKTIYVVNTSSLTTTFALSQGTNFPNMGSGPFSTPVSNAVTSLAFSPDGSTLYSGCLDQTICSWSTTSGTLQNSMTSSGQGITSLAIAPNGQTLFAGDQGGVITPWMVSTGSAGTSWPAHAGPVWSLACSADGTKLVSGGDDHIVQLWQTANGAWVTNLTSHTLTISRTCFAPDGSLVATAGNDTNLWVWSARTGAPAFILAPHTNPVIAMAFSPDATFIATGGGSIDNDINLWGCSNGALLQATPLLTISPVFTNGVSVLAVSPDTSLVAAAGDRIEGGIHLWNRFTVSQAYSFAGHTNGSASLAFSPSGRYLADGGIYFGTINLWDLTNNDILFTFNGHTCTVVSISFNPTGTLLASAGQTDGLINIWTNGVAAPLYSLTNMSAGARAVAFSPDGTLLAAAGSDSILMWQTTNFAAGPVWTCTTETVGINSLSFSPNGTFLTFGRDDGTVVRMWNPRAAPVFLNLGITQAGRFTIGNPSHSPFLSVLSSSNLTQWGTLTNIVAATNLVQVTDPAPSPKERFYRVTTPQ
jgi:WD40 repeat protein